MGYTTYLGHNGELVGYIEDVTAMIYWGYDADLK